MYFDNRDDPDNIQILMVTNKIQDPVNCDELLNCTLKFTIQSKIHDRQTVRSGVLSMLDKIRQEKRKQSTLSNNDRDYYKSQIESLQNYFRQSSASDYGPLSGGIAVSLTLLQGRLLMSANKDEAYLNALAEIEARLEALLD